MAGSKFSAEHNLALSLDISMELFRNLSLARSRVQVGLGPVAAVNVVDPADPLALRGGAGLAGTM